MNPDKEMNWCRYVDGNLKEGGDHAVVFVVSVKSMNSLLICLGLDLFAYRRVYVIENVLLALRGRVPDLKITG